MFISVLLTIFSFSFINVFANDFGIAWINMIRNNSRFDINLDLTTKSIDQKLLIFQKISSESTFKLKFLDIVHQKDRFLKVAKDSLGVSRIISVDQEKDAGIFKITKDYQNKAFLISSENLVICQSEDFSVQLSPSDGQSKTGLWEILGRDFSSVKIKNQNLGGFLSKEVSNKSMLASQGSFLVLQSLSPSSLKKSLANVLEGPNGIVSRQLLELAAKEIEASRIRNFAQDNEVGTYLNFASPRSSQDSSQAKIMAQVQNILQVQGSGDSGSGQNKEMQSQLKANISSSSKASTSVYLQIGDIIKLVSQSSGLTLANSSSGLLCTNLCPENADFWIVKMPIDSSKTTSNFGSLVKNGSSVKLQNLITQQFLSVSASGQVQLSAKDRDPSTEFLITDSENKDYVLLGNKISLIALASQGTLISDIVRKSESTLEQSVAALLPAKQVDFTQPQSTLDTGSKPMDKDLFTKGSKSLFYIAQLKRNIESLSSRESFSIGNVFTRAPFDDFQAQEFQLVPVELKNENSIIPGATFNREINILDQDFQISGYGYYKIANFSSSSFVKLPMMRSKGCAWVSSGFSPGEIAFGFIARTNEQGIIEVNFGTNMSQECMYKLQIGINSGRSALFIRKTDNEILAQENLPEGLNIFGKLLQIWVCFKKGFFICGFGTPGKNIILSAFDEKYYSEPTKIGFSSGAQPLEIAELKDCSFVQLESPETFKDFQNNLTLKDEPVPLESTLRGDCYGTVSFDLVHDPDSKFQASFYSSKQAWIDKQKPNATIEFQTSDYNEIIMKFSCLCSHTKKLAQEQKCSACNKTVKKTLTNAQKNKKRVFISFSSDFFCIGLQDYLKPFLIIKNRLISAQCKFIVVSGRGSSIEKTNFSKPLELVLSPVAKKSLIANFYDLVMIMPFWYTIGQDGPTIEFKDQVSGKSYYMGKANAQGSKYTFILAIDEKGLPAVTWLFAPEDSVKTALMIASTAISGASESLRQASTKFESTGDADDKAELPALIAAAASVVGTTVAAGVSVGAAALKTEATLGRNKFSQVTLSDSKDQSKLNITSAQGPVGDEKIDLKDVAVSSLDSDIVNQKLKVKDQVISSMVWQPTDKDKFVSLLSTYRTTIGMINHPETINDPSLKSNIISMVNSLVFANNRFGDKTTDPLFIQMLLAAINNPYFLTDLEQKTIAKNWKAAFTKVLLKEFKASKSVWLPPLMNFPSVISQFKPVDFVTVTFGVNTQDSATIFFVGKNSLEKPVGVGIDISKNQLKVNLWDEKVFTLEQKVFKQGLLSEINMSLYSITYDRGTIVVSQVIDNSKAKGKEGLKKEIFRWTDPYPMANVSGIAVSGSNSSVVFQDLLLQQNPIDSPANSFAVAKVLAAEPLEAQVSTIEPLVTPAIPQGDIVSFTTTPTKEEAPQEGSIEQDNNYISLGQQVEQENQTVGQSEVVQQEIAVAVPTLTQALGALSFGL